MAGVNDVPFFDVARYKNDPEEKAFKEIVQDKVSGNFPPVNNISYTSKQKTEINGSKAIYETKGRSLLAIATENDISLHRLLENNDLEKDGLLEQDQLIFLEKKSKEGDKDFYIVQKNETLYDVAQKNGIRLSNLYAYNNLRVDEKIYSGSKLKLRELKIQPSLVKDQPVNAQIKTYEVQSREGLYAISKKYGVTIAQLKEWNNLTEDNLKVGQQIIVSK
ncbi:MAG: LysM peptidoglycan-binding domain-containing protein [Chitinophagaceae bacterium]|nr:LysM peptidoglycan-binding domain-containing protein [Chitinophagaceae bacterium]